MNKVYIIAEAGVNHNGNMDLAKQMIDVAVKSGVDAVKFQTFNPKALASHHVPKAKYQMKNKQDETHLEMLKKLSLNVEQHKELLDYCVHKNIDFLSSPFDMESIDVLVQLGLDVFKIPSGEITNLPYLRKLGRLKKKIILSTGMSDLKDIELALDILMENGTLKKDIILLHCNASYPTPIEDVNLKAMLTIKKIFNVRVGYSDHTVGVDISLAAVALGATVIEKHFTLDKNMEGPDHLVSLDPNELKIMVEKIRGLELALGSGVKKPTPSEIENMAVVRKTIVAAQNIEKGDVFSEVNLTTKRAGQGISPMDWDKIIGLKAKKSFLMDDMIEF